MLARLATTAAALSLLAPAAASAKSAPITGTLSKPGYTVVALGYDGTAVSSHARSFKIVPRTAKVTLQLRDSRGKYAGPVIVATRGKKAVLGIKAGAKLGTIKVLNGYAKTAKPLNARFADATRTTTKVPAGNGRNFGLVKATGHGPGGRGGDTDGDGVPNAFDIDVDGDKVLNPLERGGAKIAQAKPQAPAGFNNFSQLFLELDHTVNADAGQTDIDTAVADNLELVLLQVPAGTTLDCGGLSWCSAGGTGMAQGDPRINIPGTPYQGGAMPLNDRGEFRLLPHATTAKIGSGDTMIERTPDGRELPGSLAFVFNTVPAIQHWTDGAGNTLNFSYPAPLGTPGTRTSPAEIAAGANGDYTLTLTFWRPQRRAIASAGEGDGFIDIGGLGYQVNVASFVQGAPGGMSPQCGEKFSDTAPDRAADPANLLTMTVNLSACARSRGQSLGAGQNVIMDLAAFPADPQSFDHANQMVHLRTR
jgi:hypothetical protein